MIDQGRKMHGKRKKINDIGWGRSLVTTIVMIILIGAASFGVTNYINEAEEKACFERLYEEADNLAGEIEMYVRSDREELELLASVIAEYDGVDSPELWELLNSYDAVGMMSRIELLIPGDQVLIKGKAVDAHGLLSFEKEASMGAHITDREQDILDENNYIVRHYVPVVKDGKTVAMLYGVIELGELPEEVNMNPYSGKGAMYIIDGKTGDFLVDTWHHEEGGNMWKLGQREMAPGYDPEQLKKGIAEGDSRYVVFVSKTVGEYLYFYYEPMEINEWRIAVSVPESVVFASASEIRKILNVFLLIELVCFVVYFLWMVHYTRRITDEKQRRLETLNYIYDVEKLLFNAHEKKENIHAALEKIGNAIPAEKAGFWILDEIYDENVFLWEKKGEENGSREICDQKCIYWLLDYFRKGNEEFEACEERALKKVFAGTRRMGIVNLMAVPVEDIEGNICGILAVFNMAVDHAPAALLKNLKFSFSMFCRNLKKYAEIKEQSDRDVLTGLYNRNRYERDRTQLWQAYQGPLTCIYIDVNGLHEMNNSEGHDKGDAMLKAVAKGIMEYFQTEYIYRTGGDEFIILSSGIDDKEAAKESEKLAASLRQEGYHISIGIEYEEKVSVMSGLIKKAEEKMYEEKRRFYEQEAHDRRRTARK